VIPKNFFRRVRSWFAVREAFLLKISADNVSKHIFEHVRNLGLCAIVLGAAHYEQQNPAHEGPFHILTLGFLFTFGSLLYWINIINGYQKLKAAGVNHNVLISLGNFYSLFTYVIINSLMRI
jgi:hypothetical protein